MKQTGSCKAYTANIPRLYKFTAIDHLMFGYVQGIRKALPSMTIMQAISEFQIAFSIDDEQYCAEAIRLAYYRILNSILAIERNGDDIIL